MGMVIPTIAERRDDTGTGTGETETHLRVREDPTRDPTTGVVPDLLKTGKVEVR
jgi:hypothetical protein